MSDPELNHEFNPFIWATKHHLMGIAHGFRTESADTPETPVASQPTPNEDGVMQKYLRESAVFKFGAEAPSITVRRLRRVAAFCLARLSGAEKSEIQQGVEPEARQSTVGPSIFKLLEAHILRRVGDNKHQIVAPHPAFISVLAQSPEDWQQVLDEVPNVDPELTPDMLIESIQRQADTATNR